MKMKLSIRQVEPVCDTVRTSGSSKLGYHGRHDRRFVTCDRGRGSAALSSGFLFFSLLAIGKRGRGGGKGECI